ncbi:MAG TPA: hypothetical protein VKP30_08405 [Polyangiaceae bacterium]|nr:hypothetical protein [Polyangiaceae bacterium]
MLELGAVIDWASSGNTRSVAPVGRGMAEVVGVVIDVVEHPLTGCDFGSTSTRLRVWTRSNVWWLSTFSGTMAPVLLQSLERCR